jgi:hypothetical protein
MTYIFLDESGDLGFGKGSSKWFLFTLVVVDNPRILERVIKKVRRQLSKKYKRQYAELHAYNCDNVTRIRILKALSELDISVVTTILNKNKVYVDLKNQKHLLYNYSANIILDRLIHSKLIEGLQAVDFISWAIFRKYEKGDLEFYEIIKNRIIDERLLFSQ